MEFYVLEYGPYKKAIFKTTFVEGYFAQLRLGEANIRKSSSVDALKVFWPQIWFVEDCAQVFGILEVPS